MESKPRTHRTVKTERLSLREIQVIDFLISQNNKEIYQIDIRHYQDFQKGFIPKSVNIDYTMPEFDEILDGIVKNYEQNSNKNEKILFIIDRNQLDGLKEKITKYNLEFFRGFLDFRKYDLKKMPLDQCIQFSKEGKILVSQNEKLKDFMIIDIRNEEDYLKFHLQKAVNLQIEDLFFNFSEFREQLPKLHNIYIYGPKPPQVSMAASILKKNGFNNSVYISMYQLEDLLYKNGLYTPANEEIIPQDLQHDSRISIHSNLSVEDQQKLEQISQQMDDQEIQDIQEINNNISGMTGGDKEENKYNIHKVSEEMEDSEHSSMQQRKMTTQKSDSIEDDYADEEDFPAQLEPVRETNESLKEKIKKEQVQHTIEENNKKPVEIPGKQFMSKRSIIHNEIQARNFRNSITLQNIPKPKEEKDMEGFTLEHILQNSDVKFKKTKIICTLGPASSDVQTIIRMIDAGMNIVRLNFSHGNHEEHHQALVNFREAQKQRSAFHIGVMLDTKGPEVRIGQFENNAQTMKLEKGQNLQFTYGEEQLGNSEILYCNYKDIVKSAHVDNLIHLQEGLVSCKIKEINSENNSITTEVLLDGEIQSNCELFMEDATIHLDTIQEQDEEDIVNFALKHNVDFISLSFTRSATDVETARDVLGPRGTHINIIAKIDSKQGVANFDEIAKAADGIMIARGDLGLELTSQKVFVAQKYMTQQCNKVYEKPIICATQMLQSMINNPRPTRAEASDVANAVLDGCDCVMLSKETSIGSFPVAAVETMSNICKEAELCGKSIDKFIEAKTQILELRNLNHIESLCCNAVMMSFDMDLPLIVTFTQDGEAARICSKMKPKAIIIAISDEADTIKRLTVVSGVKCFTVPTIQGTQTMLIKFALQKSVEEGLCNIDDNVAFILDENSEQSITIRNIREEVESLNRL